MLAHLSEKERARLGVARIELALREIAQDESDGDSFDFVAGLVVPALSGALVEGGGRGDHAEEQKAAGRCRLRRERSRRPHIPDHHSEDPRDPRGEITEPTRNQLIDDATCTDCKRKENECVFSYQSESHGPCFLSACAPFRGFAVGRPLGAPCLLSLCAPRGGPSFTPDPLHLGDSGRT